MSRLRLFATALLCLVAAASAARGAGSLKQRIQRSFLDGDYERAAALIERHLEYAPRDPVMLYNAACAYSRLGEIDRAASCLRRAVEAGLIDVDQIPREPDLEPLRDHPIYRAVVERIRKAAVRRADDALERWRTVYGDEHYRYDRDEQRRIAYAAALDRTSYFQMRRMIERQTDHLLETLFSRAPQSYLLVAVPTPADAGRLFPDPRAGGIYEHETRRLIARDIGAALRHELVHALHYGHMEALNQRHPLWVQEGLATLYESYRLEDDGSIEFLPNERHNIVRALAQADRVPAWRYLFKMTDGAFMARAPRNYPVVRSIFEFVAERGRLVAWYEALVETYRKDRSGVTAFRLAFDRPLDEIEQAWRRWVLQRPALDTFVDPGDAALGIETHPHGSNDGVLISRILPGSAAAQSKLEVGDVIVSVDGVPTRTPVELRAVIGERTVGEPVVVRARRRGAYFSVVISLRPLRQARW